MPLFALFTNLSSSDNELDEDFAALCEEIKTAKAARAEQEKAESQNSRSRLDSTRNSGCVFSFCILSCL